MTSENDFDAKGAGSVPAFPILLTSTNTNWDCGLSKRELFAAMAMQGICADGIPGSHHGHDRTALEAVAYADALLKELSK